MVPNHSLTNTIPMVVMRHPRRGLLVHELRHRVLMLHLSSTTSRTIPSVRVSPTTSSRRSCVSVHIVIGRASCHHTTPLHSSRSHRFRTELRLLAMQILIVVVLVVDPVTTSTMAAATTSHRLRARLQGVERLATRLLRLTLDAVTRNWKREEGE